MNLKNCSIYLSLILRHKPEEVGITLDKHGWAKVDELIKGVRMKYPLDKETLEEIVATDNKQRYSFNEDHTLIRANQGHSVPVDVELEQLEPPEYLYHGTATKYMDSIWDSGLVSKNRLYVHMTTNISKAAEVGKRHGKPIVYQIRSGDMHRDGFVFYRSVNNVWLTKEVPTKYLEVLFAVDDLVPEENI
jgi:putative RNA 2'-phosphotransferase